MPIKVVIADDHVECRRSLRPLVESRRGFWVVAEAGSGRQAIERAVKLDPDVVFIDFRMPGMDGVEAGRQIQDSCPDVAVILMSFEPDHLARRGFEAGAAGYLLKSEIPRYLFGTIATALRQRSLSGRSYPGTGLEDMAAREG